MESITVLKRDRTISLKSILTSKRLTVWKGILSCLALVLILAPISAEADECDFMALISQEGTKLCNLDDGIDNATLLEDTGDFFEFLRLYSESSGPESNNDGYGVAFYRMKDVDIEEDQYFYLNGTGHYYTDSPDPDDMLPMIAAQSAILNPINNATIVLGHDRNATGGSGNHPFRLDWNGKTYSFMHNGGISGDLKTEFLEYLIDSDWYVDPGHASNWGGIWESGQEATWIDSELLFHYLMSFVIQERGEVARGIYTALNQANVYDEVLDTDYPFNFVLADWKGLYLFKSMADPEYQVHFKDYASGLVGVKTASAFPSGGTPVPQYKLVHIPVNGNSTEFESLVDYHDYNLAFDHHEYHKGYNWVCYPVLLTPGGTPITSFFEQLTGVGTYNAGVDEMTIEFDGLEAEWNGTSWDLTELDEVSSIRGYKLEISDYQLSRFYLHEASLTQIDPGTELTLDAGPNYVPYFLEGPQHPSEAFPDEVLDRMRSIGAEDWFMLRKNGEFLVKQDCGDPIQGEEIECFTLYYGSMYVVDMEVPMSFVWNQPGSVLQRFVVEDTENFTFETDADYIKVVIESIENGENVIEIGAMQNGTCVGAEVVNGYPINLRVYAESLSGVTYEIVTEDVVYRTIGDESENPLNRRILATESRYYENGGVLMNLADITGSTDVNPTTFSAISATPNPFNPATNISFLLNKDTDMSLCVYNVRGQLVATLMQGLLHTGVYTITWNGTSDSGSPVASGVYYYQLSSPDEQVSNKMLLVK